jgi:hypothetical protein
MPFCSDMGETSVMPSPFAAAHRRNWTQRDAFKSITNVKREGREKKMAARKKKTARKTTRRKAGGDLIISKARTKAAAKKCNVGGEFYGALDQTVRGLIADAEARAIGNKRKTLKAVDL